MYTHLTSVHHFSRRYPKDLKDPYPKPNILFSRLHLRTASTRLLCYHRWNAIWLRCLTLALAGRNPNQQYCFKITPTRTPPMKYVAIFSQKAQEASPKRGVKRRLAGDQTEWVKWLLHGVILKVLLILKRIAIERQYKQGRGVKRHCYERIINVEIEIEYFLNCGWGLRVRALRVDDDQIVR